MPHQRTLRATIDRSYALLPADEQALRQRLSVFAGGFSLEAAVIGQGQSSAEIAGRLVLRKRMVESNVANILAKLELSGRAQVVRWAVEHGLVSSG